MRFLRIANLALLLLFPIAWAAPLMRAGVLPLFKLKEISVLSGIKSLWETDIILALIVILFALIAPIAKIIGLSLVQFGKGSARLLGPLHLLGRLAMADIFLIAIYITLAKGLGVGRLEIGWGLYLFSACILASLAITHATHRRLQTRAN